MTNAILRLSPFIVGAMAMFAISLAYVEFEPKYQPTNTASDSLGG